MDDEFKVVKIRQRFEDRAAAEAFARHHQGAELEECSGPPPSWWVACFVPEDMLTEAFLGGSPPGS